MTEILGRQDVGPVVDPTDPVVQMAQAEHMIAASQKLMGQFDGATLRLPQGDSLSVRPAWDMLALTNEQNGQDTFILAVHPFGDPTTIERVAITTSLFTRGRWAGRLLLDASTNIGINNGVQAPIRVPVRGRSLESHEQFESLQAFRIGRLVGESLANLLNDTAVTVSLDKTREVARQHNLIRAV